MGVNSFRKRGSEHTSNNFLGSPYFVPQFQNPGAAPEAIQSAVAFIVQSGVNHHGAYYAFY